MLTSKETWCLPHTSTCFPPWTDTGKPFHPHGTHSLQTGMNDSLWLLMVCNTVRHRYVQREQGGGGGRVVRGRASLVVLTLHSHCRYCTISVMLCISWHKLPPTCNKTMIQTSPKTLFLHDDFHHQIGPFCCEANSLDLWVGRGDSSTPHQSVHVVVTESLYKWDHLSLGKDPTSKTNTTLKPYLLRQTRQMLPLVFCQNCYISAQLNLEMPTACRQKQLCWIKTLSILRPTNGISKQSKEVLHPNILGGGVRGVESNSLLVPKGISSTHTDTFIAVAVEW